MTTTNPPWTNDNEYKDFNNNAGLQEVANACVGYVAADLPALVWRAATSGSRRLWGRGPAPRAAVVAALG
jgi:hypothetical protein